MIAGLKQKARRNKSMCKGAQAGKLLPGEKKKLRSEKIQVGGVREVHREGLFGVMVGQNGKLLLRAAHRAFLRDVLRGAL